MIAVPVLRRSACLSSALALAGALACAGVGGCSGSSAARPDGGGGGAGGTGPAPPPGAGHITTIAGTGERATQSSDGDGDGVTDPPVAYDRARFDTPMDTALDGNGGVLILDWNGHKVRRLTAAGMVEFVVGTGIEGDACERPRSDGTCPLIASELNHMTDVTFDGAGRLVIAAWHNAKIKVADLAADALRDACGSGTRRFAGDGGPCADATGAPLASFDLPSGLAYDKQGNLFIADQANQVIRRLGSDGVLKTVAGNCPGSPGFGCPLGQGYAGDGGMAVAGKLHNNLGQGADPQGKIAIDAAGNLYIADTGNHVVRKVVPGADGVLGSGPSDEETISTFAGTGIAGYAGDGGPAAAAKLREPHDVAVGPDGVYIADTGNNCVRRVGNDGVITTVAGQCNDIGGFGGDGGPATAALLNRPYGVTVDAQGNLFIADTSNNRVREVAKE
jgi:NHL repeat-containing protein